MKKWCWPPAVLLTFFAALVPPGRAQAPELPPEAELAFHKGIIAASLPNFPLALRYFQEARRTAPDLGIIYYNLGLAESRIPGHELRAVAWFGAYLTAHPAAPHAPAVIEQMTALAEKSRRSHTALLEMVPEAAARVTGDDYERTGQLAQLWVQAGDISVATTLAGHIQVGYHKREVQSAVAELQIRNGDLVAARQTLASALVTAETIGYVFYRSKAQTAIADAQFRAGDTAGAEKTFALALNSAEQAEGASDQDWARLAVVDAQARNNDVDSAQRAAALIRDEKTRSGAQFFIVGAQARRGDFADAQQTAELIQDPLFKDLALERIARFRAGAPNSGDLPVPPGTPAPTAGPLTEFDWTQLLDDEDRTHPCPLNTPAFLSPDAGLKAVMSSAQPQEVFLSVLATAAHISCAQNVLAALQERLTRGLAGTPVDAVAAAPTHPATSPAEAPRDPADHNPVPAQTAGLASWSGTVTLNFDLITGEGCVDATDYLGRFGVTVSQPSAGSTVSIGAAGRGFHQDVIVPSPPNALYVPNNLPVRFVLNFDRALRSVSFTRARLNAGSSGVNTVGWTATAYSEPDAGGIRLAEAGEGAQYASSPACIPAASFALASAGIRSVIFVRTAPREENTNFGVSFAVLDDLVLTE